MKKQLIKSIQTIQQAQNVKTLSKEETRKVKGGGDNVVEEEIING